MPEHNGWKLSSTIDEAGNRAVEVIPPLSREQAAALAAAIGGGASVECGIESATVRTHRQIGQVAFTAAVVSGLETIQSHELHEPTD